jgi:hypothetical protein
MCGAIPPLPQYFFMAWYLVKHRDNCTFTFIMTTEVNTHYIVNSEISVEYNAMQLAENISSTRHILHLLGRKRKR